MQRFRRVQVELLLTDCISELCWRQQGRGYKRCYEVRHSLFTLTWPGWACGVYLPRLGRSGGNWNSINVWGKSTTTVISFLTWCYGNFAGLFLILISFRNYSIWDVQNSNQPKHVGWGNRAVELLPCCIQTIYIYIHTYIHTHTRQFTVPIQRQQNVTALSQ